MNFMDWIGKKLGWEDEDPETMQEFVSSHDDAGDFTEPVTGAEIAEPVISPPQYLWDTPENARHSVRVICDEEGVSFQNKNLITAVIAGESNFYNTAKNINRRPDGSPGSTDWGICQINDRFHIGEGKTFPSVEYVLENPDKIVRWMIKMFRAGHLNWWHAYNNGSYRKHL